MKINFMLDLETVGLTPGSAIISIALVPFGFAGFSPATAPYYEKINFQSSAAKLSVDSTVLDWWAMQDPEVRNEAFSGTKSLEVVLQEISDYLASFKCDPVIWGKGSDFDNVLLAEAYDRCDIKLPWNFRNNRCFRTLTAIFPYHSFDKINTKKHSALEDAKHQAEWAESIFLSVVAPFQLEH